MTTQLIALLVSFLIFSGYLIYVVYKVGVLSSISDSWYALNKTPLFTFFIWGSALGMMVASSKDLMVLSGMVLCFVGAAAAFKEPMTRTVHYVGALGAGVLVILSMVFEYHAYAMVIGIFTSILYYNIYKVKNHMWWSELVAFLGAYIVVAIDLISKL